MQSSKSVAVITGAASGIGFALAQACVQRGMNVVMADNAITVLDDSVKQLGDTDSVLGVVCDVTRQDDLDNLVVHTMQRFGRVDWLFNNAGISGPLAPVWEVSLQQINKVLDVNLNGVIHGVKAFLPVMFHQQHRSKIINIASIYALCSGSNMAAYAMSKHAILALSESLHFDLQRLDKPVDVSVVCPSFANTQLLTSSMPADNNKFHHMLGDLIARSRPAEDVAEHIIREVEKNTFYILPDKEVKEYCQQRTNAITEQQQPHQHSLEKIIATLSKRALAK